MLSAPAIPYNLRLFCLLVKLVDVTLYNHC
jgi:hypothetical protein